MQQHPQQPAAVVVLLTALFRGEPTPAALTTLLPAALLLAGVLERDDAVPGSHDYKETNSIFNSMPKEELFRTSAREIGSDVQA